MMFYYHEASRGSHLPFLLLDRINYVKPIDLVPRMASQCLSLREYGKR